MASILHAHVLKDSNPSTLTSLDPASVGYLTWVHGVGARRATLAHVAEQVPKAELQATIAAGAPAARTVPKVNPAAE